MKRLTPTRRKTDETYSLDIVFDGRIHVERAPRVEIVERGETDEEKVMGYVPRRGFIKRADCQRLLGVSDTRPRYILRKMRMKVVLLLKGTRKGSRYVEQ